MSLRCGGKIGVQTDGHILLQVAVEKLVVVEVVHALGEDGEPGRILLRRDVRDLQRPAHGVDIGPGELRYLAYDVPAVICEAGAEVGLLPRGGWSPCAS